MLSPMILMKAGDAAFVSPGENLAVYATATVEFPGLVRSATAVLTGFIAAYGRPDGPIEDHHVGMVGTSVVVSDITGGTVTVDCTLSLQDDNGDDPLNGSVGFCVIADVIELPAADPAVSVTEVLTES